MRNIESVNIEKAIVHILDKNSDMPIFTDIEQEMDEEVHEFLAKHIIKCLKDDENRKAKFRAGENIIKNYIEELFLDNSKFIDTSKKISNKLFDNMKGNQSISSCDLVICIFSANSAKYIGILKLDYQKTFVHEIEYVDENFKVSIVPQDIGLPSMTQKIQKSVFIKELNIDDEYDMIILDKQNQGQDSDVAMFFIDDFLNSEIIFDNKYKTKVLKKAVEKWTRRNLKDDFEKSTEIREEVNSVLKNENLVDLSSITDKLFDDKDVKESFIDNLEEEGIEKNQVFEVDKQWVAKKMKRKYLKTDTGFEIKGEFESFEDQFKYCTKRNGDGTVDLIIKNVRMIMER